MESFFILAQAEATKVSKTPLMVIICYLGLLLGLALFSGKLFRGTSKDYFVASHSIGPFMLLKMISRICLGTISLAIPLLLSTPRSS